jgi:hypothetical protein
MRKTKAISAKTPPATPAMETTRVRSRIGSPQADEVTFFVANPVSHSDARSLQTWSYLETREWYSLLGHIAQVCR